jgi:DNA-binding response OmpR family regulator
MPKLLFLSECEPFKADILDQVAHHAPEFEVVSSDNGADVIVVDENMKLLEATADKESKAPIILLGNGNEGAEAKVYQVLDKPFALSIFLDSLRAAINIFENSDDGVLSFNRYILYPSRKEIVNCRNDVCTKLTEKEVSILKYLYKNKDKVVDKNDLMQEVWGYAADVATHTVETHIYRLRQKVEQNDLSAQLILTSDGGYQLVTDKGC